MNKASPTSPPAPASLSASPTTDELLAWEERLEEQSTALGAQRYMKELRELRDRGYGSERGAGARLLREGLESLRQGIQFLIDGEPGKRGPKHEAAKWAGMVGADVAAYFTLKVCLDLILDNRFRLEGVSISRAARTISQQILEELRFRRFEQEAKELYAHHERNFRTTSARHKAKVLSASLTRSSVDVSDLDMPRGVQIVVGVKLISTLIETTGLFEDQHHKIRRTGRARDLRLLVPTEETLQWLEQADEAHALASPLKRPMVVPPLDWDRNQRGGYLFSLCARYPLVRRSSRSVDAEIAARWMPTVYKALNRIQATAWRINPKVLGVVEEIFRGQSPAFVEALGLAQPPDPLKPLDIATNEEARARWRRTQEHFIGEQRKLRRRRRKVVRVLELARTFAPAPAIYFPHNLDFRGRVYPIPSLLQPQGDDLAKGLLVFAHGKPLGERGAAWLAIHGANCLDVTDAGTGQKLSKLSIDERVRWIEEQSERIERVAADPFSDPWWTEADSPLQFLAFCFEWAGYAALRREGRGHEYVCALPVAMDGTCNGIQHLSAMLLDAEGGRSVNLTAEERPQDFYQDLADGVLKRLRAAAPTNELARLWLERDGLVNRKLAKGPGMTFSYGAKQFGFAERLQEGLEAHDDWPSLEEHFSRRRADGGREVLVTKACQYLAKQFYEVLKIQARSAVGIMEWLAAVARLIAKSGQHLTWVVPGTDFKVLQTYWEKSERQLETKVAGRIYKPASGADTDKVDVPKHASAIAANVVHSLDAAALMTAVKYAADNGMDQFAMVHDSYGTVPADCDLLAQAARHAFYKLYCGYSLRGQDDQDIAAAPEKPPRHDVVDDLERQFLEQAGELPEGEKPPPRPARIGTLDPGLVLVSKNFMS
jgi:DNA-directed RNA polymerase